MSRLDDYRNALLAAFPDVSGDKLDAVLDVKGDPFAGFVIDHGLGPLWHERTGHDAFHESRMLAEALFLAQAKALLSENSALWIQITATMLFGVERNPVRTKIPTGACDYQWSGAAVHSS